MGRSEIRRDGIYEVYYQSPTGGNEVVQAGLTGDRLEGVLDGLEGRGIKYDIIEVEVDA